LPVWKNGFVNTVTGPNSLSAHQLQDAKTC
jgi:hypothetical protein